jgi:hypothetical protein
MVNGKEEELLNAQQILRDAGIENSTVHLSGQSVRDTLIRYAEENAVDLIVMGAYGHSRLRRFLIGSHILKCCKILTTASYPPLALIFLEKTGRVLSPFIKRPHLFQSFTCIINDFFTILFGESRFLGIWKDIQN